MGALMMFGMRPGPLLFEENPEFVWGLIGSMYVGNIVLILTMLVAVPIFVRILDVPKALLNGVVMAFILVGAYSINNSMFDVVLTVAFGLIGYFMKKMHIPAAPLVLALVLGSLLENSLRQSLILSDGNPLVFFARPISGTIMWVAIILIFWPVVKNLLKLRKSAPNQ